MSKVMKIVLIVLLVIVLAVVGMGVYVLTNMRAGAVETVEKPVDVAVSQEPETITVITDEPTPTPTQMPIYAEDSKSDNIVNILLVGTDSRSAAETQSNEGRSDSMILASINTDKGTITLVSFMRDSRVHRIGKSGRFTFYGRLNGAYSGGYAGGGPGELINTLNENFKLDIQEYICIGFDGFAALIDKIGGLDVDCDEAEINFINDRIKGGYINEPDIVLNAKTIKEAPGVLHLDGAQCLIYARNRHTGFDGGSGSDYDRVNRQQEIIQLAFEKVTKQMNEQSVLALISFATNYVSTNMGLDTMSELAKILLSKGMTFTSNVIPAPDTYDNFVDENGEKTDQLEFDLDAAAVALNTLLYGDSFVPTPTPAQ
ncbi:MAG: LCP family protein [Clostridiaceae bacterium]